MQYFPAHRCLQPFPNNRVCKNNSIKKWFQKKLQATRQSTPVYHVKCLSSLLMVWGWVPSLLFIERSTCETSKCCHKGVFETLAHLRHRGFFWCYVRVIYNQTCYCWLPHCNHIKLEFLTGCSLDAVQEQWDITFSLVPSLALSCSFSTEEGKKQLISGSFMIKLKLLSF